jgi:hypothetical protein
MPSKSFFILLFSLIFRFSILAQGPIDGFLKGKGTIDIALSGGFQHAEEYIGANGSFVYPRTFYMAGLFGEIGVHEKIDLIANVPFIGGQFQDLGLYAKAKVLSLSNGKLDILPALGYSFPLTDYLTESGKSIGQQAQIIQSKIVLQSSLGSGLYLQGQVGYDYALEPVPSSFLASGKVAFSHNKWYFDAWYSYQNGLGNKVYQGANSFSSFRELSVDFHQIGAVIFREIKNGWGVFLNSSQIIGGLGTYTTFSLNSGFVKKIELF